MEPIVRDVMSLDESHRRALEDVLGRELHANDQLVIRVLTPSTAGAAEPPRQSLEAWSQVYDGLSDDEIKQVDEVALTRAKLSRNAP